MFKKMVAAAFVLLASAGAQAEMMYTDWQTEGDKQAYLDYDTGIEWIRLSQTENMSINEVLSELGEGGQFEGWRLPTESEVDAFFGKFYTWVGTDGRARGNIQYNSTATDAYWNDAKQFINPMGYTHYTISGYNYYAYSYGLHMMDDGGVGLTGVRHMNLDHNPRRYYFDIYDQYVAPVYDEDYSNTHAGVYLVSDGGVTLSSINNPALNINNANAPINQVPVTFLLSGAGLLMLMRRRKA